MKKELIMTLDQVKARYPIGVRVILRDNSLAEVIGHDWYPPIQGNYFAGIIVRDKNGFHRMFNPAPDIQVSAI